MGPNGFIYNTPGCLVAGGEYSIDTGHGIYAQGHTQLLTPDDYSGKGSLRCSSYYHLSQYGTQYIWYTIGNEIVGFSSQGYSTWPVTAAGLLGSQNWADPSELNPDMGPHPEISSLH